MVKRTGRTARKGVNKDEQIEPQVQKRVQTRGTKEIQEENVRKNKEKIEEISVIKNEKNEMVIKFGKREYKFDLQDENVQNNKKLLQVLGKIEQWVDLLKVKSGNKNENILKITDHFNFSAVEYLLYLSQENIERAQKKVKQMHEEEKCCICQFELYEKINDFSEEQFEKQLKENDEEDVVGLSMCDGHFFHQNCLIHCVEYKHIKCPICSRIYGEMYGDQPDGTMKSRVDKNFRCAGYENCGTIIINYHFPSGIRNGKHYSGTGRTAYLPDNEEGRECLELLKIGFERKLLFTIGRSVTTGQDNTTVWNGVHHKTNTSGGPAYFGYPDPTYFNRLKLELAMKGVYPKDIQNQDQQKNDIQDNQNEQKIDQNANIKNATQKKGRGRKK
ncbi:hypothetical protein PPERSA_01441 [Pseudocohnilembus persalinus]|uniref:RING-type E3 ubiquitin transferase n=1 Tax=Pseudocohnilembus persalinus TaxID=266149 RepID=A0A0V0QH40_PSEPJ|nr:hypothetical protein PPERSA_01441 [Pseudocohnilembus persalinus]|eukprot:KRX01538.1 hypothetical protein PPERSA_01441 [Pseudocohnilembus persalinus]